MEQELLHSNDSTGGILSSDEILKLLNDLQSAKNDLLKDGESSEKIKIEKSNLAIH